MPFGIFQIAIYDVINFWYIWIATWMIIVSLVLHYVIIIIKEILNVTCITFFASLFGRSTDRSFLKLNKNKQEHRAFRTSIIYLWISSQHVRSAKLSANSVFSAQQTEFCTGRDKPWKRRVSFDINESWNATMKHQQRIIWI